MQAIGLKKPRAFGMTLLEMPRRVKQLLAEAEAWCAEERGRRTELAKAAETTLQAVSAWFREYRKARPAKQPTAEQALAILEFLKEKRG
jgi:hypothetical protein